MGDNLLLGKSCLFESLLLSALPWLRKAATASLCLRLLATILVLTAVSFESNSHPVAATEPAPILPGQKFTIEFPQLALDRRGQVAKMQVRIPDTYNIHTRYPLFVWLSGGKGSHSIGASDRMADPQRFVLVGLPYPQGANDRYQDTMVGDFPRIWAYHRAMLKVLNQRVPNISSDRCVIAGFSNGGHCIDGYLKMYEPANVFSAFILIEGGGYRGGRYARKVQGKPVLVLFGDQSPNRRMGPKLTQSLRRAGMVVTSKKMKETGHSFPAAFREDVSQWLSPSPPE